MLKASNQKQYLHILVIFTLFLCTLSFVLAFIFLNFSPSSITLYIAFLSATLLYFALLMYFIYLYKKGLWFIPYSWKNVRKRPVLYAIFYFPLIFIPLVGFNLSIYPAYLYTKLYGEAKTLSIAVQAKSQHGYKSSKTYYFSTPYGGLPIFKISSNQYQHYQGQDIQLTLQVLESQFGTEVQHIEHMHVRKKSE